MPATRVKDTLPPAPAKKTTAAAKRAGATATAAAPAKLAAKKAAANKNAKTNAARPPPPVQPRQKRSLPQQPVEEDKEEVLPPLPPRAKRQKTVQKEAHPAPGAQAAPAKKAVSALEKQRKAEEKEKEKQRQKSEYSFSSGNYSLFSSQICLAEIQEANAKLKASEQQDESDGSLPEDRAQRPLRRLSRQRPAMDSDEAEMAEEFQQDLPQQPAASAPSPVVDAEEVEAGEDEDEEQVEDPDRSTVTQQQQEAPKPVDDDLQEEERDEENVIEGDNLWKGSELVGDNDGEDEEDGDGAGSRQSSRSQSVALSASGNSDQKNKQRLQDFTNCLSYRLADGGNKLFRAVISLSNGFPTLQEKDNICWKAALDACSFDKILTQRAKHLEANDAGEWDRIINYIWSASWAMRGDIKRYCAAPVCAALRLEELQTTLGPEGMRSSVEWVSLEPYKVSKPFAFGGLDLENRTYDKALNHNTPLVKVVILSVWFRKKNDPEAVKWLDEFKKCPLPLIALCLAVIKNIISEYRTGYHTSIKFSEPLYRQRYLSHLKRLEVLEGRAPTHVKNMRRQLWNDVLDSTAYRHLKDEDDQTVIQAMEEETDFNMLEAAAVVAGPK
ncbi:hypothetical protein BV25DRAFT_1983546 [Artomyces pyxidatus]|uniref:Uncharacterized protein n=1 Tax=Artomyces pyxidatus TaxID=48021 RepID=A0ACB8SHT1_9AGAM|nr:hypothetical protein BV25DRAFT_1983546 [Artomyces pyxidatus]